jgi:outer membrane protein insertion porin family
MWRLVFPVAAMSAVLGVSQTATPSKPQSKTAVKNQQKKRTPTPAKPASETPPPPAKFPIETLRVTGNRKLAAEKIIAASGLKIGQAVDKAGFDEARERLLATGGFESVGYMFEPSKSGAGVDATFEVVEVAPLFSFRFEDLGASEQELRAVIAAEEPLFGDEIPATRAVLARYEEALAKFIESKSAGGSKILVEGRPRSDLSGSPAILFRPAGQRPRIAEVRIEGNEKVPTVAIANALSAVAVGTEFSEHNIRLMLDASVRRLYEAKGLIRVNFPKVESAKPSRQDIDGVALIVTIQEGPEYKLGTVRFAGIPQAQQAEIQKLADFKGNETANFDAIDDGLRRIVKRYKANGYLKVETRVDRTVHESEKTVDLVIHIMPGPQYVYGKLDIQGLDILSEPVIRKMWGERSGKPFDPDFPDAFLKRIRDERMFDNLGETIAATRLDDAARTADVTLTFKGAKPQDPRRRTSF